MNVEWSQRYGTIAWKSTICWGKSVASPLCGNQRYPMRAEELAVSFCVMIRESKVVIVSLEIILRNPSQH